MQYQFTEKQESIKTVEFSNSIPIPNVTRITFFQEEGISGVFSKKEFQYSWDNATWTNWNSLSQSALSGIQFRDQPTFYLKIKYTRTGIGTGNILNWYLIYEGDPVYAYTPPIPIINADLLQGEDGQYYLDLSHHFGMSPTDTSYINGALALRDISIAWLDANKQPLGIYVKEASLNLSSGFAWGLDGQLYVDVSVIAGSVSQIYVDSSLFARDASIAWLSINMSPSSHLHDGRYVKESSLGSSFVWNGALLDVSIISGYSTAYIDSSFALRDASITNLYLKDAQQKIYIDGSLASRDASIAWLISKNYLKESSINLSTDFAWDASHLLIVNKSAVFDPSYNFLFDMIIENSTNIGGVNYDSSNFIFTGNDLQTSVSNLDSIMGLLAPARPNLLTNKTLLLTSSVTYAAKLPSGLIPAWYYSGIAPGIIINDYAVDNTFRLTTPSFVDTFRAGFFGNTTTRGTLYGYVNGVLDASYDMTLGFGNTSFSTTEATGILRFNNEAGYGGINSDFWRRVEAYLDITTQRTGGVKYSIGHSEAATSNEFFLRFDPSPGAAKWSISPSVSEGALNSVYLSGIQYYGINSKILVSFTAAPGIFKNAYHSIAVGKITSTYGSQILLNPISIPSYDASFNVANQEFTFDIANQATGSGYPTLAVTLYKPNFTGDSSTLTLTKRLNTYLPTRATVTTEYFTDESKRLLIASSGTDVDWDETNYTIFNPGNGAYAQVQNGTLRYPVAGDYANFAFSGDKEYIRRFTKTGSLSSGTLTFTGFNPITDSSIYGFGNTNIILWLTDQDKYFDLALEYGTGGDGSSINQAKGAWTARSSSSIAWSLGTDSLGNEITHINQFALKIIFKNISKSITQITLS
jgi:hypothetical protein